MEFTFIDEKGNSASPGVREALVGLGNKTLCLHCNAVGLYDLPSRNVSTYVDALIKDSSDPIVQKTLGWLQAVVSQLNKDYSLQEQILNVSTLEPSGVSKVKVPSALQGKKEGKIYGSHKNKNDKNAPFELEILDDEHVYPGGYDLTMLVTWNEKQSRQLLWGDVLSKILGTRGTPAYGPIFPLGTNETDSLWFLLKSAVDETNCTEVSTLSLPAVEKALDREIPVGAIVAPFSVLATMDEDLLKMIDPCLFNPMIGKGLVGVFKDIPIYGVDKADDNAVYFCAKKDLLGEKIIQVPYMVQSVPLDLHSPPPHYQTDDEATIGFFIYTRIATTVFGAGISALRIGG